MVPKHLGAKSRNLWTTNLQKFVMYKQERADDERASRDEAEEVAHGGRADVRLFDVAAEVLVNDSGVAALHRTLCGAVGALGGVHGRPASHSFVTEDREFRKITPEGERSHLICPVCQSISVRPNAK